MTQPTTPPLLTPLGLLGPDGKYPRTRSAEYDAALAELRQHPDEAESRMALIVALGRLHAAVLNLQRRVTALENKYGPRGNR